MLEPTISFKGMDASPAVEARIREHAAKFGRFADRLQSCHIVVDAPHRHGQQGTIFHVRIDIRVPGHREIIINREPELNHAHEDVYVAIRDAFNAATRKLEDMTRDRDPHRVKQHAERLQGKVARIVPEEGFGFIDAGGEEIYFHRDSVTVPWAKIAPGDKVHFARHDGQKGPYASGVTPAG